MKLIKALIYIRRYFESKNIFNGLIDGELTVKILSKRIFHVKIYNKEGNFVIEMINKHLSFIPKTTEDVINVIDQLNLLDKKKSLKMINSLSDTQRKLISVSKNYNKFIAEAPMVII